MIVAIVGANGFIGTRLVEMFHLGGRHTVVPVVRRAAGLALPARFALDARIGDALDVPSLAAALAGCDAVVHTALGDPRQIEAMPAVLCAAAGAAGVHRVVYISSAAVHGQAPEPGTTEDTPLHCRHAIEYNNAKVRAERAFFRSCTQHGLDGFALRPAVVFGPRSRWIADLASDLRQSRAWLLGEGDGVCNTLYVDNLVEAVACSLVSDRGVAGAYLIGDAEQVTWSDFYLCVAASLGLDPAAIQRVAEPAVFHRTTQERIASVVAGRVVQSVLPAVPARWKTVAKRLTASLTATGGAPDAWRIAPPTPPRLTEELMLLQQCRWALPSDRAEARLGYRPTVSFPDAIARSLAWLAFAEGRA